MRWIPKEKGKNGENAPTNKFVVDNVDCLCKMLKMRDEYVVEPPHDKHWSDRQASFDKQVSKTLRESSRKSFN